MEKINNNNIISFFNDIFGVDVADVAIDYKEIGHGYTGTYFNGDNFISVDVSCIESSIKNSNYLSLFTNTTIVHELIHYVQYKYNKGLFIYLDDLITAEKVKEINKDKTWHENPLELDAVLAECFYLYILNGDNNSTRAYLEFRTKRFELNKFNLNLSNDKLDGFINFYKSIVKKEKGVMENTKIGGTTMSKENKVKTIAEAKAVKEESRKVKEARRIAREEARKAREEKEAMEMQVANYVAMEYDVKAETKYTFKSVDTLIKAKHIITKKTQYRMLKYAVEVDKKTNRFSTQADVILCGENCYLRESEIKATSIELSDGSTMVIDKEKNITTDYMILQAHREFINSLRFDELYRDEKNGRLYYKQDSEGNAVVIDLKTGAETDSGCLDNAVRYVFFDYTSGTAKEQKSIWCKDKIDPIEKQNEHVANIWDCYTKEISKEKAVKLGSRIGLSWSGNVLQKSELSIAFYNDIFDKTTTENDDDVVTDDKDKQSNTSDGIALVDALAVMKMYNLRNEYEAIKVIGQERLIGINKFQLFAIPHILFIEKLKEVNAECEIVGKKKPAILCDKNCKKADFVGTGLKGLRLSLMSIGKLSNGNFSIQLLNKVLTLAAAEGHLSECEKELEEMFMSQITSRVVGLEEERDVNITNGYILDVLSCIDPNNPAVIGRRYSDMLKTIANMINKLSFSCDSYNMVVAGDISALFGIRIIQDGEALCGKFSRYDKHSRIGEKAILIKYPSMGIREFLSVIILAEEEACIRVNKKYEEGKINKNVRDGLRMYYQNMADATIMLPAIAKIFKMLAGMDVDFDKIQVSFDEITIKYLFGREESIALTTKGYKEVQAYVNSGVVKGNDNDEDDEDSLFMRSYKATKKSRSSKSKMKKQVKKFNDILKNKTMFNPNSPTFLHEMYVIISEFEGMIGIITRYNDKCIAMLIEALNGNVKPAKKFLYELFETQGKEQKYVSDYNGTVSPMFAKNIVDKMRQCIWNRENIIAFLNDCIRVYRLYQETTIDAAKTGIYLTILLTVNSVQARSLLKVKFDSKLDRIVRDDFKKRIITVVNYTDNGKVERDVETSCFVDSVSRIQDALIKQVNEHYRKIYDANRTAYVYSDDVVARLKRDVARLSANKDLSEIRDALYLLKSAYFGVTDKYIKSLSEANPGEDEVIETAGLSFRNSCKSLGNTFLRIISRVKCSDELKANVLLGISIMDKKIANVKADSHNRMAYSLLPGYTFLALTGSNEYTAYSDVLQYEKDNVGKTFEFENGAVVTENNDTVIIKDCYTGVATLEEFVEEIEVTDESGKDTVKEITVCKACAEREIELEKVDDNKYTMIIESDNDIKISADSILTIQDNKIVLDYDITSDDSELVVVGKLDDIVIFDGKKKYEYYIDAISEMQIFDSILGYADSEKNAKSRCLVISLTVA